MARWTHSEEDSYRLPEGMQRIEYDADTQVYTFRDHDGKLYKGEPGADYGHLTPVNEISAGSPRHDAFDTGEVRVRSRASLNITPASFHDILPAGLITAAKSPVDKSVLPLRTSARSPEGERSAVATKFVNAVRRSTLPKMQGVVHDLRRSMTSARSRGVSAGGEEEQLFRRGSSDLSRSMSVATTRLGHSARDSEGARGSAVLHRNDSVSTTRSGVSTITPMMVKD